MDQQPQTQPEGDIRLHDLAAKAAAVQDLLRDIEIAMLPAGETASTRLLRDLKQAWREFRDAALLGGDGQR